MTSITPEQPTDQTVQFNDRPTRSTRQVDERPGVAAPHLAVAEGDGERPPLADSVPDVTPLRQQFGLMEE